MNINLVRSIEGLYDSLVGKNSYAQKALYVSFFPQFRSNKRVDHEPLDFCKFIFWKSQEGIDIDVLFSDDAVMDQKRKGKRIPGEKPIFLHNPNVRHSGEFAAARLESITKSLSEQKSAPFFLEEITLHSIFVFDLKPQQFIGELFSVRQMCWEWDTTKKEFNPITR